MALYPEPDRCRDHDIDLALPERHRPGEVTTLPLPDFPAMIPAFTDWTPRRPNLGKTGFRSRVTFPPPKNTPFRYSRSIRQMRDPIPLARRVR